MMKKNIIIVVDIFSFFVFSEMNNIIKERFGSTRLENSGVLLLCALKCIGGVVVLSFYDFIF